MAVSIWSHESRYLYKKTQEYLDRESGIGKDIFLPDFFAKSKRMIEGLDITKERFIKYSGRLDLVEFVYDLKILDHFDTVYSDDGDSPLTDKERKYIYSFLNNFAYDGDVYSLPEKINYVDLLKKVDEKGTEKEYEFLKNEIVKQTSHFVRVLVSEISRGDSVMMLGRWLKDLNALVVEHELDIKHRIESVGL